jgi:hypothetical protein
MTMAMTRRWATTCDGKEYVEPARTVMATYYRALARTKNPSGLRPTSSAAQEQAKVRVDWQMIGRGAGKLRPSNTTVG